MKQTLKVFILSLLLSLSVVSPALAEDVNSSVTPSRNRQKMGDIIKEKIDNLKDKKDGLKDKKDEIKSDRQEIRLQKAQNIIKRLRQGITQRYESTLKLRDRIRERITKLETDDKTRDLTAAKDELKKFDTAKYLADLKLFDAKVEEIKTSSAPAKLTPELKELAKTLQSDIKDLRQILAQTLRLVIKSKNE